MKSLMLFLCIGFFGSVAAAAADEASPPHLERLQQLLEVHLANLNKINSYTLRMEELRTTNSASSTGEVTHVNAKTEHWETWFPEKNQGSIKRDRSIEVREQGEDLKIQNRSQKLQVNDDYVLLVELENGIGYGFDTEVPGAIPEAAERKMGTLTMLSPLLNGFGNGDFTFKKLCQDANANPGVVLKVTPLDAGLHEVEFYRNDIDMRELLMVDVSKGGLIVEALQFFDGIKSKELNVEVKKHGAAGIWFPSSWEIKYFTRDDTRPNLTGEAIVKEISFNEPLDEYQLSLAALELKDGRMVHFRKANGEMEMRVQYEGFLFTLSEYVTLYPDGPLYKAEINSVPKGEVK